MMDHGPVSPVTRTALLRWRRPRATFYDMRGRIVDALEVTYGVQRFQIQDQSLTAVLLSGTEIELGPLRASVFCVADSAAMEEQLEQLAHAVEIAATLMDAELGHVHFAFQHLLAWPKDCELEEAYRKATAAIYGESFRSEHSLTDTAVLMDGERSSGGTYQVEFGVVDDDQAPLRVLRRAGRVSSVVPSAPDAVLNIEFPKVATFIDSNWLRDFVGPSSGDVSSTVQSELGAAETEAGELAKRLHAKLTEMASHRETRV